MGGYRDMTFCPFHKECKEGKDCHRALTKEVLEAAEKRWGKEGAPISHFLDKPKCFKKED